MVGVFCFRKTELTETSCTNPAHRSGRRNGECDFTETAEVNLQDANRVRPLQC